LHLLENRAAEHQIFFVRVSVMAMAAMLLHFRFCGWRYVFT